MALSGSPVLQRSEPDLDHNWGTGSPDPAVNADRFSARWTLSWPKMHIRSNAHRSGGFTLSGYRGRRAKFWMDDVFRPGQGRHGEAVFCK
jgi:hypothetical protein